MTSSTSDARGGAHRVSPVLSARFRACVERMRARRLAREASGAEGTVRAGASTTEFRTIVEVLREISTKLDALLALRDRGGAPAAQSDRAVPSLPARVEPVIDALTKADVARSLGVSTRWVERHLVPSTHVRGGKSWYLREDLDRQLRTLRPPGPKAAVSQAAPRVGRAKKKKRASSAEESRRPSDTETRIAHFERRLRGKNERD